VEEGLEILLVVFKLALVDKLQYVLKVLGIYVRQE